MICKFILKDLWYVGLSTPLANWQLEGCKLTHMHGASASASNGISRNI